MLLPEEVKKHLAILLRKARTAYKNAHYLHHKGKGDFPGTEHEFMADWIVEQGFNLVKEKDPLPHRLQKRG
jgi:hypothetical protein